MTRLFVFVLFLLATAFPALASERVSIHAIVDNSGALQDPEEALVQEKALFHRLTLLRKRPGFRKARITVVSLNDPRTLWTGTPKDLFKNGGTLLPKLDPVSNGCADLVGAFQQVRDNLAMERADKAYVLVFSSLIWTNIPCQGETITLPQEPPQALDLRFLRDAKVAFYWVNHVQKSAWVRFLRHSRIDNVELHDQASTVAVLAKGLFERGR